MGSRATVEKVEAWGEENSKRTRISQLEKLEIVTGTPMKEIGNMT